jgi:formylglycine-generating enzyme
MVKMKRLYKYDIAFSFAEEELVVATQIAEAFKKKAIAYYLYTEHDADNLGKSLLQITQQVYGTDTRHVLLITSEVFVKKYWTSIESQIVQIAAAHKPDFIFRLKLDDTRVDGISDTLFSLKWKDNAEEIAAIIHSRLEDEKGTERSDGKTKGGLPFAMQFTAKKTSNVPVAVTPKRKKIFIIFLVVFLGIIVIGSRFFFAKKTDVKVLPEKVYVPGGAFMMGNDSSWKIWRPAHKVSLPAFYISKTEVTVAEYRSYCNATGNAMPPAPSYHCGELCPVVNVTWEEGAAYCRWVGGRLPTEAEWEYAAGKNGQLGAKYSGANAIDKVGYYAGNTKQAHQVGQKKSNALGLFDMSGNVAEWCSDWMGPYEEGEQYKPVGAAGGVFKVLRGGHYQSRISSDTSANELLIAYRDKDYPIARKPYIGFRVVWDADK